MKYLKLSEIANMQSGLVLNRKEAKDEASIACTYKRLNLRSLDEEGRVDKLSLDNYNASEILDKQIITVEGDVVVRMFAPICPVIITAETSGLVIPSQLSTIRIKDQTQILPEYLRYYLAQDNIINKMLAEEGWQSQRTIKISTIANLYIPLPTIEQQITIAKIVEAKTKRKKLYQELIQQEETLINVFINKVIGGNSK
ncbi:MAG TPA: restriction endonuclease subunit S [Desulfitobacterium dehalogenans]|uniref:Restriction endonuclease subunit S n=1 Tax=Desulfitobacterium dehalogenans TaxID=36854 RepID=A0A7C6Z6Y0_9FIRM|nr:restriction endonuclease subunit S [Desulfitobacterium dehalogenans]